MLKSQSSTVRAVMDLFFLHTECMRVTSASNVIQMMRSETIGDVLWTGLWAVAGGFRMAFGGMEAGLGTLTTVGGTATKQQQHHHHQEQPQPREELYIVNSVKHGHRSIHSSHLWREYSPPSHGESAVLLPALSLVKFLCNGFILHR